MATRSAIGYCLPSGKVRAVYVHWNGNPEYTLPILKEHYNSIRKIQALIRPGSMSQLRTTETWDSDYRLDTNGRTDFTAPRTNLRAPQPLYHCERQDVDVLGYTEPPHTTDEPADFWREFGCEHLYIFSRGQGWCHYPLWSDELAA